MGLTWLLLMEQNIGSSPMCNFRNICVRGRAAEALVFQTGLGGFDSHRTLLIKMS